MGMDVVITDHHLPHDTLPNACAVVNPHRADSKYPFKHLAGVGVAFRLGEALVKTLGGSVDGYRRAYIDLCTIGTVTDIMPLALDNRVLVSTGLRSLAETRKPGIRELLKLALLDRKNGGSAINVETISFGIGPRLNAASRMGETDLALNLLMTRDEAEAGALANQLNTMNMTRREEQTKILTEASQMAEEYSEHRCLVVAGSGWSSGLIGLVAGKLLEGDGRPAIVIAYDEQTKDGRGSARSIPAFHIAEALQGCHDLLREYGGHACAAGFSIDPANISALRTRINEIADARLTDSDLQKKINADMVISLEDLNEGLVRDIGMLAPFGNGNPEPIFVSQGCRLQDVRSMGKEKQHLRLTFRADGVNRDNSIEAPLWNMGKYEAQFAQVGSLDVCYTLAENVFNGNSRLQLQVKDLRLPD
jgi:single-stranded-DNA-specific exonuclease